MDGGVHFTAILRCLLAAVGQKVEAVSAFTSLVQETLRPADTLHAVLQTGAGHSGTFSMSCGTEFKAGIEVEIVTDRGSVLLRPREVTVTTKNAAGELSETKETLDMTFGVKEEMVAFAAGVKQGKLDPRMTADEALEDLKLLEAMLKSGQAGGQVVNIA